jgi:hypothetical protein
MLQESSRRALVITDGNLILDKHFLGIFSGTARRLLVTSQTNVKPCIPFCPLAALFSSRIRTDQRFYTIYPSIVDINTSAAAHGIKNFQVTRVVVDDNFFLIKQHNNIHSIGHEVRLGKPNRNIIIAKSKDRGPTDLNDETDTPNSRQGFR